jgi:hypothetical protein
LPTVEKYLLSSYHLRLLLDKRITVNGIIKTEPFILVELDVAKNTFCSRDVIMAIYPAIKASFLDEG